MLGVKRRFFSTEKRKYPPKRCDKEQNLQQSRKSQASSRPNSITLSSSRAGSRAGRTPAAGLRPAREPARVTNLVANVVADRLELSRHVEIARTCLRQIGNQVCDQVCDLHSVMEFRLNSTILTITTDQLNTLTIMRTTAIRSTVVSYLWVTTLVDRVMISCELDEKKAISAGCFSGSVKLLPVTVIRVPPPRGPNSGHTSLSTAATNSPQHIIRTVISSPALVVLRH